MELTFLLLEEQNLVSITLSFNQLIYSHTHICLNWSLKVMFSDLLLRNNYTQKKRNYSTLKRIRAVVNFHRDKSTFFSDVAQFFQKNVFLGKWSSKNYIMALLHNNFDLRVTANVEIVFLSIFFQCKQPFSKVGWFVYFSKYLVIWNN